jgi:spermidine synthase
VNKYEGLVSISILLVLFYLISWWLSSNYFISKNIHRRLWNSLLLFSFLISSGLGLLLIVSINFKIEFSWIKQAESFHVYSGVLLFLTALFHILWHLKYFFYPVRSDVPKKTRKITTQVVDFVFPNLKILAFILGLTSIISQLSVLQHFLGLFGSNELIIGLIFSLWMVYTAIGAWMGSVFSERKTRISLLFTLIGLFPVLTVILFQIIKPIIVDQGASSGPGQLMMFTLLFLPFCGTSGYLFSVLSHYSKNTPSSRIGIYSSEVCGSIAGGIIFTICCYFNVASLNQLVLLLFINSSISIIYNSSNLLKIYFFIIPVLAIILFFVSIKTDLDFQLTRFQFQNEKLLFSKETSFGKISICENQGQLNYYNDGMPLFSSGNTITCEEAIHYNLVQISHPKRILVISGDPVGLCKELAKYKLKRVVYLSVNPYLLSELPDSLKMRGDETFSFPRVEPICFLSIDPGLFDGIIINLNEPSSYFINKYYTDDFLLLAKKHLAKGGLISYALPTAMNYQNNSVIDLNSCLYFSLKKQFDKTILIAGQSLFFIGSDSMLTRNISYEINNLHINTDYVNSNYINDDLLTNQSMEIENAMVSNSVQNSLWHPLGYYKSINYWLSIHQTAKPVVGIVIGIIFIVVFLNFSITRLGIFVSGFSTAGLEYLLFCAYQVGFGNFSQQSGFLISLYMSGALGGVWIGKRNQTRTKFFRNLPYFANIVLIILISILLKTINLFGMERILLFSLISALLVLSAGITGYIFAQAVYQEQDSGNTSSGYLYGSDLLGASLGMLGISLILFPIFGLSMSTCFLIGIIFVFLLKSNIQ